MNEQQVTTFRVGKIFFLPVALYRWVFSKWHKLTARRLPALPSDEVISQIVNRVVSQMRENNVSILDDRKQNTP